MSSPALVLLRLTLRYVLGATLALVVLAPALPTAAAQTEVAEASGALRLVDQPVWGRETGPLDIVLKIHNDSAEPLQSFTLQLTRYERVTSRSDLHESFEGGSGTYSGFPQTFDLAVPPGASTTVGLRQRIELLLRPGVEEAGVYPLTISLVTSDGITLDALHTHLIYYPSNPDTPLLFVPVVALNDLPARAPDGSFGPDDLTDEWPLESALQEGTGWLRATVDAIEAEGRGLALGLAPTPRLLEELADMANGYRRRDASGELQDVERSADEARAAGRLLDDLVGIFERPSTQPLLSPYSFADLPSLNEHSEMGIDRQISVGQQVAEESLGIDLDTPWLYPPGGRLDSSTLENLRITGRAARTFFSPDSLESSPDPASNGCPDGSPSFTCPVQVVTEGYQTKGYVADADLQARLAAVERETDKRVQLQRFFAETAMIREEIPSVERRVIFAGLPPLWHPPPALSRRLFGGLARAPWLQTMTPTRGLRATSFEMRRIVDDIPAGSGQPSNETYIEARAAEDTVEDFNAIGPPEELQTRLRRNLLVGQSRSWWIDSFRVQQGRLYTLEAQREAEAALSKITMHGREEITLTSREGPVSFIVSNDTGYRTTLRFHIESPQLKFDDDDFTAEIPPGNRQIPLQATAQSSGTFPLEITAETPDEPGRVIARKRIDIRSTEFNQVALTVTLGAALFVILFYFLRWMRRRRRLIEERAGAARA